MFLKTYLFTTEFWKFFLQEQKLLFVGIFWKEHKEVKKDVFTLLCLLNPLH